MMPEKNIYAADSTRWPGADHNVLLELVRDSFCPQPPFQETPEVFLVVRPGPPFYRPGVTCAEAGLGGFGAGCHQASPARVLATVAAWFCRLDAGKGTKSIPS